MYPDPTMTPPHIMAGGGNPFVGGQPPAGVVPAPAPAAPHPGLGLGFPNGILGLLAAARAGNPQGFQQFQANPLAMQGQQIHPAVAPLIAQIMAQARQAGPHMLAPQQQGAPVAPVAAPALAPVAPTPNGMAMLPPHLQPRGFGL